MQRLVWCVRQWHGEAVSVGGPVWVVVSAQPLSGDMLRRLPLKPLVETDAPVFADLVG